MRLKAVTRSPTQPAKPIGMKDEGRSLGDPAEEEAAQELEQERLAERDRVRRRGERADLREGQPDDEGGQGEGEPRERSVRPDVEDLMLEADGRLDADEGAERPQERRAGDEKGQGGQDPVAAAGQVVAELVAGEDDHQDGRVEKAQPEEPGREERAGRRPLPRTGRTRRRTCRRTRSSGPSGRRGSRSASVLRPAVVSLMVA